MSELDSIRGKTAVLMLRLVNRNPQFFVNLLTNPDFFKSPKFILDDEDKKLINRIKNLNIPVETLSQININNIKGFINREDILEVLLPSKFSNVGLLELKILARKYNAIMHNNLRNRQKLLQSYVAIINTLQLFDEEKHGNKVRAQLKLKKENIWSVYEQCLNELKDKLDKKDYQWDIRNEFAMLMSIKIKQQIRHFDEYLLDTTKKNKLFIETPGSKDAGLNKETLLMLAILDISLEDSVTRQHYIAYFNANPNQVKDKTREFLIEELSNIDNYVNKKVAKQQQQFDSLPKDQLVNMLQDYYSKLDKATSKLLACKNPKDAEKLYLQRQDFALYAEMTNKITNYLEKEMAKVIEKYADMSDQELLNELEKLYDLLEDPSNEYASSKVNMWERYEQEQLIKALTEVLQQRNNPAPPHTSIKI